MPRRGRRRSTREGGKVGAAECGRGPRCVPEARPLLTCALKYTPTTSAAARNSATAVAAPARSTSAGTSPSRSHTPFGRYGNAAPSASPAMPSRPLMVTSAPSRSKMASVGMPLTLSELPSFAAIFDLNGSARSQACDAKYDLNASSDSSFDAKTTLKRFAAPCLAAHCESVGEGEGRSPFRIWKGLHVRMNAVPRPALVPHTRSRTAPRMGVNPRHGGHQLRERSRREAGIREVGERVTSVRRPTDRQEILRLRPHPVVAQRDRHAHACARTHIHTLHSLRAEVKADKVGVSERAGGRLGATVAVDELVTEQLGKGRHDLRCRLDGAVLEFDIDLPH